MFANETARRALFWHTSPVTVVQSLRFGWLMCPDQRKRRALYPDQALKDSTLRDPGKHGENI